jgi:hypothetical protein
MDWSFLENKPDNVAESPYKHEQLELVDFGIVDKQGRRIGMLVQMGSIQADGKIFYSTGIQTARDGKPFGGRTNHYYESQEAADEAVLKSLRRSLARFAKLYGDVDMNFLELRKFGISPRSGNSG